MTHRSKFRNTELLAAVAATIPLLAHSAPAAHIDFASGSAIAQRADGTHRQLAKGSEITIGDRVLTNNGYAQLRFTDGALVSLKPGSEFVVIDYHFDGKPDGAERVFFNLVGGAMRTVSGQIGRGNRNQYRVITRSASIGIRGAEYSVAYGEGIGVNTAAGIVELCSSAGCLFLYSGDEAHVADQESAPELVKAGKSRTREVDAPSEMTGFEGASSNRDATGNTSMVGTVTTPQDRMVFGLADSGVNTVTNTSVGPFYTSGAADGTAGVINEGGLHSFSTSNGNYVPTNASIIEDGSITGVMRWGRWITDTNASNQIINTPLHDTFGDSIFHYVVGKPTASNVSSLPSATFTLVGGSASGTAIGQTAILPGTLTTGLMNVSFSTLNVNSLLIGFNVAGLNTNYDLSANNLPLRAVSGLSYSGNAAVASGSLPCATCTPARINGAFFGTDANHAGVSFHFSDSSTSAEFSGAAAFSKNPSPNP